jgi:hypothetical protein
MLIILNVAVGGAIDERGTYNLKLYDYDTSLLRAEIIAEYDNDNRARIGVGWLDPGYATEGPGGDIRVDFHKNTSAITIWVDKDDGRMFLEVSGQSGENGNIILEVSLKTVPSKDNLKIYLDNQPIGFTLVESGAWYRIELNYTHSTRMFMVDGLTKVTPSPWYTQPLNIALIVVAVVVVIGAVYWLKFRR